jgi:hypothetical protein
MRSLSLSVKVVVVEIHPVGGVGALKSWSARKVGVKVEERGAEAVGGRVPSGVGVGTSAATHEGASKPVKISVTRIWVRRRERWFDDMA